MKPVVEVRALFEDAVQKEQAAKEARKAMEAEIRRALLEAVPPGTVVNLTRVRGAPLPDYLMTLEVTNGNARGTPIFRIESAPSVKFNASYLELIEWACEATPISEKTGKDMDGKVGHALRGAQSTVTLRGQVVCSHTPGEPVETMLARLLQFIADPASMPYQPANTPTSPAVTPGRR